MRAGRPKKMVEEEILELSMELFWERGYSQVSIRNIEEVTKTKSQSLYNHFGDKERIFIAAIKHYVKTRLTRLVVAMDEERDPAASIDLALQHFRNSAKKTTLPGCFLANAIVDLGSDIRVKQLFDDSFGGITDIISTKLTELPNNQYTQESAKVVASTITNSLIGLAIASRSQPSEESVELVLAGLGRLIEIGS